MFLKIVCNSPIMTQVVVLIVVDLDFVEGCPAFSSSVG